MLAWGASRNLSRLGALGSCRGHTPNRMSPHEAAAREAEEEAGVRGPSARQRWVLSLPQTARQRRSLMVDVDLYPLALTSELPNWKRPLAHPALVQPSRCCRCGRRADLGHLIRSCSFLQLHRRRHAQPAARSGRPDNQDQFDFAWFQRLLPKSGNFFELLRRTPATVLSAAEATARMIGTARDRKSISAKSSSVNTNAQITREVLQTVLRTFLTPFDRGAITALIGALDDTVDEMQATAQAVDLYEITASRRTSRHGGDRRDAARLTTEAIPLLRDVGRNGTRLHELTERLVRIEGHADTIHAEGLKAALKDHGSNDTLRFVIEREIYKHLERVIDAFEDVADEIDGIVIDHS